MTKQPQQSGPLDRAWVDRMRDDLGDIGKDMAAGWDYDERSPVEELRYRLQELRGRVQTRAMQVWPAGTPGVATVRQVLEARYLLHLMRLFEHTMAQLEQADGLLGEIERTLLDGQVILQGLEGSN